MKIYLVGGAVRDGLLNIPVHERDWVVTGSTPKEMMEQGFKKVGKDFPVFLHPDTHEEYALARTERKTSKGYYGFECMFDESVTLEEDLARRDLTINAIAQDSCGQLIDPFHGIEDLQQKILRHVSDAFIEDPVRVLRVARFAARFHHLGFRLAPQTRLLMYKMMKQGELNHLVPERIWQEVFRSLQEKNPEVFFMTLRASGALAVILPELDALFGVPNPPLYHPEIDSGVHSLQVLQASMRLSKDPMVLFSSLVHDLGKAHSPMSQWAHHYGHDKAGIPLIKRLCERLKVPSLYRKFSLMVSEYHLLIHRIDELRAATVVKVLEKTGAFRQHEQFDLFLMVCEADARGCQFDIEYPQSEKWRFLRKICTDVSIHTIIEEGHQGKAIQDALRQKRVAEVQKILNSWKSNEK